MQRFTAQFYSNESIQNYFRTCPLWLHRPKTTFVLWGTAQENSTSDCQKKVVKYWGIFDNFFPAQNHGQIVHLAV